METYYEYDDEIPLTHNEGGQYFFSKNIEIN